MSSIPAPESGIAAPDGGSDAASPTIAAATGAVDAGAGHESYAAGFERFQVRCELGAGGMGVVLAAYDPTLMREVAVKLMRSGPVTAAERQRFVREARITGRLTHPGIPPIYELGLAPGDRPYFAMKVVRGHRLNDRLEALRARPERASRRDSPFPLAQRIEVVMKVGEALELAHAHGVIHRDLKPENVMVGEFGEVQLMDWGLAKPIGTLDESTGAVDRSAPVDLTQDGYVAGTPAYMSPEQARGELGALDARTDVFALGALLYEMLSLSPPYLEADVESALELAATGAWLPIPERIVVDRRRLAAPPRELAAIAYRAMDVDPAKRYPGVGAMIADLRAYLAHEPVAACPDALAGRLVKLVQRHPRGTLVLASALVVAILVALLSAAWRRAELLQLQGRWALAEARTQSLEAAQAREAARQAEQDRVAATDRATELGRLALRQLSTESREMIGEFNRRWSDSRAAGEDLAQFFASLGTAEHLRYLAAFDDLFRVRALSSSPPTAADHFHRALLRHAHGDHAGAAADYDQAHALDPRDPMVLNNRGLARKSLGQHAEAKADYDLALTLDPSHMLALTNRAVVRQALGDRAGARADLERALAQDARSAIALGARGNLRHAEGDLDGALADFDQALAIAPRNALLLCNRGAVRHSRGDHAGAVADFDQALALNPRDAAAYSNRALARGRLGDHGGAAQDLERALALEPNAAGALFNRGTLRLGQGDHAGAIADFDRVLAADPRHAMALCNRGLARLAQGDLDGAVKDLALATELAPTDARTRCNLGNARARRGDLEAALADFDCALVLDPANTGARLNRSEALRVLGRAVEAEAELDRCLERDPQCAQAYSERGRIRAKRGELAGAIADLDRAIELAPRDTEPRALRGTLRHQAGNEDGAIADYLAVLEGDPRSWSCAGNLGQLLARRGKREEALRWLRQAREHCTDPTVRQQLERWIGELGG